MKAIIVIDVPVEDSVDFGHLDIRAGVVVKAYDDLNGTFKEKQYEHVEVNPMPQERILPASQVDYTNYGEEPWFSDG